MTAAIDIAVGWIAFAPLWLCVFYHQTQEVLMFSFGVTVITNGASLLSELVLTLPSDTAIGGQSQRVARIE